jgi:transcriptional regulator of NAD metabolism
MNQELLKSARIILTAVAIIAAAGTRVYAIDSNNRYVAYGVGQRSCEDYIKLRDKRLDTLEQQHPRYTRDELYEIVDKIVEHWIAGFLTAHDLYVTDTYDLVGKTTMDELKVRLEKICRANGKQYFAEAMVTLVLELNPQRVKADSGK